MRDVWCSGPLTLSAVLLLALPVLAQVPAGAEFMVNASTTDWGNTPGVAVDPSGGFAVVWRDRESRVSARWFVPRGFAWGSQRQASVPNPLLLFPSVAADRKASIVAWARPPYVEGQIFTAASQPVGAEFQIGNGDYIKSPATAAIPGGFVVAWVSAQSSAASAVLGRRYDRAGQSLGPEFVVSDSMPGVSSSVAIAASERGDFVAVWAVDHGTNDPADIVGQLMDASGTRRGAQFRVNEVTTGRRFRPDVAADDQGSFVVTWMDRSGLEMVKARRFDASGSPLGAEFVVNTFTFSAYYHASIAGDAAGNFAVVWDGFDGIYPDVFGRRFTASGSPRGVMFRVNTYTSIIQGNPSIADDGHGNLVAVWESNQIWQDGRMHVFGQRYGGLVPAGLAVMDANNNLLEPGDTFTLAILWRNVSGAAQTFQGRSSNVTSPPGLTLSLSADAAYGPIPDGSEGSCVGPCYAGSLSGQRPSGHLDARFLETVVPDDLGQVQRWKLHIGDSFTDVPRANPFYYSVEILLHHGVTAGCGADVYCPAASTTREQMSVFVLVADEGAGYVPPACTTPVFGDVPASSPFCRWIEELARRGVTGGCGGGNYCPAAPVAREQMAVFVLRTLDPTLDPPVCTTPVFNDVPASSPFCRWIEELVRRGVVSGCGGGNYCPTAPVTREQMAVFLTGTFGLTLYGT